jgi:hypothetical protein
MARGSVARPSVKLTMGGGPDGSPRARLALAEASWARMSEPWSCSAFQSVGNAWRAESRAGSPA